jgi:predicted small metal-binding protein
MDLYLNCPCGEVVEAKTEDELVEKAQVHLREAHPDRVYTREQILFFAS